MCTLPRRKFLIGPYLTQMTTTNKDAKLSGNTIFSINFTINLSGKIKNKQNS